MKKVFQTLIVLTVLCLLSTSVSAEDYATFESFYDSGWFNSWWVWTGIVVVSIAGAAITFFTLGAAAPAWMAVIGGWIGSTMGLHGAAAVSAGLALLGGGSIAAGGLGMAGGVALLSAVTTFSTGVVVSYGTDIATEKWNQVKFVEVNKDMNTLPLPRNKDGGIAYRTAVNYLKENFVKDKGISEPGNQHVLKRAGEILSEKMVSETKEKYILKDTVLLSLIYLQTNRFQDANTTAQKAINLAGEIREEATLPRFIIALSELAMAEKECSEDTLQPLRVAYYHEGNNKLIPLMTAVCMDRMMYQYHYGKLNTDVLFKFSGLITSSHIDEELAATSLNIFITRCLVELKRTQQDIYVVAQDKKAMQNPETLKELKKRYECHKDLLALLQQEVLPKLVKLEDELPEDSELTVATLTDLLSAYWKDLPNLNQKINNK